MEEVNNMEKVISFIIGAIVLIGITIFVYTRWGFEITIIFLIVDGSISISVTNMWLQKLVDILSENG